MLQGRRGSVPKIRRKRCRTCKGVRVEKWNARTDEIEIKLVSFEEDDRGRRWAWDYCQRCLQLAGRADEIDRRINARLDAEERGTEHDHA